VIEKLYPPMHFKIDILISIAIYFVFPVIIIIPSPYHYAGGFFILSGLILNIWADQLFKRNRTVISPDKKPTALVIKGPFKISRNPMYLGMFIALIGLSTILGSLSAFIGPVLFFMAMDKKFIPMEEINVQNVFGEEFDIYRNRVRRWI